MKRLSITELRGDPETTISGNSNLGAATLFMVHTATEEDKYSCSKCSSSHVDIYEMDGQKYMSCLDCGNEEVLSS